MKGVTAVNNVKTVLLLGLMTGLLLAAGRVFGGTNGLAIGLVLAVVMNFSSYFFSDKLALRAYRAQPVSPTQNPEIYRRIGPLTANLCRLMELPEPKLWVIPDDSPNAFATGRDPKHASVAVTVGLLKLMNTQEVEGVIGHELGHVKNRDILVSSVAATIAGALTYLGYMLFFFGGSDDDEGGNPIAAIAMIILAPIAAMLIQMAISRTREYGADAAAARYTGSPNGLISGLQKLENYSKRIPMRASPSHEHMFIIKPFSRQAFSRLFSTHPSTEERIARLEQLRYQQTPY